MNAMSPLTLEQAFLYTVLAALVIFFTRAFPFVLFSRREPPAALRFVEKYIPPLVMAVLVVYCVRNVSFTLPPYGLPELVSLAAVAVVHWKFGNALVSIGGGTVLFMVLIRLW